MELILLLAVAVIGYILLEQSGSATGGGASVAVAPSPDNSDNTTAPTWIMNAHLPITNDPATWPAGDSIWTVCQAIASAEGAHVAGSVPDRLNNPGDLSDGFSVYGGENHDGSNVTHFPSKDVGWQWLYNKITNIWDGTSSVYSPDMTWREIAQKWAGNSSAWVANVTAYLGVSPDSTLNQFLG